MDISKFTEFGRKMVRQVIAFDWREIEANVGVGTCDKLVRLHDEYYDALDKDFLYETDESSWNLDLAKNNLYEELFKGLRVG